MSIYAVNLNEFNDRTLIKAINEVPQNSVILFEDIDCMRSGKTRGASSGGPTMKGVTNPEDRDELLDMLGVTLSGLLNVLDGFSAPENVLFVMTTNRFEILDRALLRPGRIDYRLYMGEASEQQKIELYRRFFASASQQEAAEYVQSHPSAATMAEFQGLLLRLGQECISSDLALPPHPCTGEELRTADRKLASSIENG